MKKLYLILTWMLVAVVAMAQQGFKAEDLLQPRTGKQQLVNDFAGILTGDQQSVLERKLVQFDDSSSTQIAVVVIPNLGGYDISDYSVKLGRAWGIGGKEFNNGVLVVVAIEDRKVNIATGYGVEGALPDALCKRIIEEVMKPGFKGGDYYRGIDDGTDAIIKATRGEYKAPAGYNKRKGGKQGRGALIAIVVIILIISFLSNGGGRGGGFMSRRGYRGISGPFIFPGSGGGWSGGGGSGDSGGFGGFGGGSFGGGGASGSW